MIVRSRRVPGAVAAALGFMLTACSSGGSATVHRTIGPTSGVPTTSVLTIRVEAGHFVGMPAVLRPGVRTVSFDNTTSGPHMAALGRLAPGHTGKDLAGYLGSPAGMQGPPPWLQLLGGVDDLDAGHHASWTGALMSGSYVLISLTPDRTGRPEVLDGLVTPFTVANGPAQNAPIPTAGATVTLQAGGRLSASALPTGTTAVRVVNQDSAPRLVDVTVICPGKSYDDVMHEAASGQGVPPSLIRLGGSTVPAGGSIVLGIEAATSGSTYVVFDPQHVQQGAIVHETAG